MWEFGNLVPCLCPTTFKYITLLLHILPMQNKREVGCFRGRFVYTVGYTVIMAYANLIAGCITTDG